ncbi:Gfo/Idh/MocA family oxidoreductase [Flexivirga sp. ID2601S]|uniref:Gfo/Idh/MocA family oxidoreductase n=1 Tax=Flexivirga aerilata TaxID=1656889 RepID=A0A849AHR0_9MICO|nr:Gfo/Idh/MocA family oxidoreductase [Flexivirga aerilata]NNG40384.1 Gfo/Idh/MocA family oxidoreductase [Flexivirga aerilata]
MRFGLVGTGHWARVTHAPGLHASEHDLVGVWGRDATKAAALAGEAGVPAFGSYDDLLASVDAVAYAVPPDVQAPLALQAAAAGKHLLLDKPVALDPAVARDLRDAAHTHNARSVVFFTARFTPETRSWLGELAAADGCQGAWVQWVVANQRPESPYRDSPWRQREGALWDIGPHLLATLIPALGPVTRVVAVPGEGDTVHLTLTHEGGAVSTATLALWAPPAAYTWQTRVWGGSGVSEAPGKQTPAHLALATAANELGQAVADGREHPLGLDFGARVVELLAEAGGQLR